MADRDPLNDLAYGLFAMHQDIPAAEFTPMSDPPRLVAPRHQSPEWFAAASSPDASLLDMAPELVAMPPMPTLPVMPPPAAPVVAAASELPVPPAPVVAPDADIISIYAPETSGEYRRRSKVAEPAAQAIGQPAEAHPEDDAAHPRARIQMGLLKELADLDP